MRVVLVTCMLLTVAALGLASPVSAQPTQPPGPGPLVGECNFLTNPCWDGALACVWFSLQIPVCLTSVQ